MTRIILVRHGQTAWNVVERFRGREDLPLDQTGLWQASRTAERIAEEWSPRALYSSPLRRARQTAEAAARRLRLPLQVHPGLIDIDYGRWQGLTPEEAGRRWPGRLRAWYESPRRAQPPGGEALALVMRRCRKAALEIAGRHPGQTVVLVGHTVVNRTLLLAVLGLGLEGFWRLRQEPCAVNLIEIRDSSLALSSMNDTCHLRKAGGSAEPPGQERGR